MLSLQAPPEASLLREADLKTERDNHLSERKQQHSAPGHQYLRLWALSWLVTEAGMSPSSAGVGEVGRARKFAAVGRAEPPEGSAQGWWEGWAAGAACSQKSRGKAQAGEETKALFFSLRGMEGNKGWDGTKTLLVGGQEERLTPGRADLPEANPTRLGASPARRLPHLGF